MIESKQEISKDLEKALQALEQAKQRVALDDSLLTDDKRIYDITLKQLLCHTAGFSASFDTIFVCELTDLFKI